MWQVTLATGRYSGSAPRRLRPRAIFSAPILRAAALLVGCTLLGVLAPTASPQVPQAWAQKMFQGVDNHDFGTVPHGAQLKHRVTIKNIWAVPLNITDIRVSCGCLTPKASTMTLKPKEEAYIDLFMDTSKFSGPKSVKLFVTVGPQFISTATFDVTAFARNDVMFTPGEVNFGLVQGSPSEARIIDVEYTGTLNWQITEIVKSKSAPFTVSAQQILRQPPGFLLKTGKVVYRLTVTLNENAPPGFFRQELLLKTNDPTSPSLTVNVEGNVQAGLTVTPNPVKFDAAKVGVKSSQKVLVRGQKAFRITSVDGAGTDVLVGLPEQSAALQQVTVSVLPGQPGDLSHKLTLHTDTGETLTINVVGGAVP